jgi:predicted transcriptional regulator
MPVGRSGRRGAGQLESEVLAALWASPVPMTPAQVQATVDAGLAYNTVHTILMRLHDKGQVLRVLHEGRSSYAPSSDAAGVAAERMRAALDAGADRAEILARFVTELAAEDEAALRSALRSATRRARRS